MRRRDLVTNLGGLLMGCYIDTKATQTRLEIPLRLRLALLLVRFAQPAEVRLRAALAPPSAQDDIQRFCLVVIEREVGGGEPPPLCVSLLV